MAEYRITFVRSARHELEVLDPSVIRRILPKIESLAIHPRPHGSRKLTGEKNLWRIRIGDYRVIYSIFDSDQRMTSPLFDIAERPTSRDHEKPSELAALISAHVFK